MKALFTKTLAVLLSAMLLFTAVPFAASAAATAEQSVGASSGITGDCTWTLDDNGTLIISGSGAMEDYSSVGPWGSDIKSLIIENGVTCIGTWAFCGCTWLTDINVSDSVISIEDMAFFGCTGLTSVTVPDSVTIIGEQAFYNTAWYKSQPNGLVYAGKVAYEYKGTMPANTSIVLKEGTKGIADSAFSGCTGLESITIPDSVTSIGNYAFSNTAWYKSQPDGLVYAGKLVYNYKGAMPDNTSIEIKDGTKGIADSAFYGRAGLTGITIPDSVTSIGKEAFRDCTGLTSVSIGNSVASIGKASFFNCNGLTSVTIPDSITSIETYAFYNCTNIASVAIPDSVTSIGYSAFYDCIKLSDIYYSGSESGWNTISIGSNNGCLTSANIHFNSNNHNINVITETDTDNYIVEQVKKYTSENITDNIQYNAIMNTNISGEIKLYLLNEIFKNDGFTDAKEGIDYLRDTSTYRNDYRFLTTNEIFCANNYYDWLYSSPGTVPRGLLYTGGWIFNGELSAYLDITTYTDKDFPNVKKNKKFLKDFLDQDSQEAVVFKEAKTVGKYTEKLIKLNNIEYKDSVKELHDKIYHAKSLSDIEKYQNQLAALVSQKVTANSSEKIYLDGDRFSEALGYSVSVVEFLGATTDNIIQMINLDKEIAKYEYYKEFLLGIYHCEDVSADMRMAAYLLLDDIKNGYYNHLVSVLGNVFKLEKDLICTDFDVWSTVFGAGGEVIGEAISTIKLAAFIDNIIVDTGDFVNQVAYTQGYAEISRVYCNKLKQDKANFIAAQTKENAWQFFEDYTMLWSLRYKGEEQYLKMNKLKMFIFGEVKTSDYTIKSDVVNDNLNLLNQKKFEFAANYTIPEGVMYSSKAVINCPVDVYVYTQSGVLIAALQDGVESDVINEYGRFAVMNQSYSGEYAKVVALSIPDDVIIKSVAHSQGLVDYSFASVNNGEVKTYSISNVSVDNGAVISTSNNTQTYAIDYDGDGNNETEGQLLEGNADYVAVSTINSDVSEVFLTTGEQQLINISIAPKNATNQMVDWFTDKEDIVSIRNGVVKALKPGNATVYAKAVDSDDVICSFDITINAETGDTNLDGIISISDVTSIQRYLTKSITFTDEQLAVADTNGDGKVDISDATYLQMYLAKYNVVLGEKTR